MNADKHRLELDEVTESIIQTKGLCKSFRTGRLDTPVLFDIDLQVTQGEFVAIMGPSGCGKSTLMHILGLMLSPSRGQIIINGQDTSQLNETGRAKLRREHVGFIFQRFNLLPTLSAYQNIVVAERIRRRPLDGRIHDVLEQVDMADQAHKKPGQLSMGQQQRIAIARAVCHRPGILLADEPTGNLDSNNAANILNLFRDIHQKENITIVMITHSLSAAQWAQRTIYMADGRIHNV